VARSSLKFLGPRGEFRREIKQLDRFRGARFCLQADGVDQLERAAL